MGWLIAAAGAFSLTHLIVAGTPVRGAVTAVIGEKAYMGVYSLASVALLVWLIFAFAAVRAAGDPVFWSATAATRWIQLLLQLLAFFFVVVGLATPNPTSVGQEGALGRPAPVKGMLRITRHPFLWGVAIWAAGHLLVNGDAAGIVLFASLLILALIGTVSIDAKRRRKLGEAWSGFARQTSNLPCAAIAAGRQKLDIGEIGWWRIVLALVLWGAVLMLHPLAFGVSPLP